MPQVIIAFGSNVGDGAAQIRQAHEELSRTIENLRLSPLYQTAPMYLTDQPVFVNAVAVGRTHFSPRELLVRLKGLEQYMGRQKRERNGPREIDLDLVAYGKLVYRYVQDGELILTVPHPRVAERRFVLQPLADLAPDFVLPQVGRVLDLLAQTKDQATSVVRL